MNKRRLDIQIIAIFTVITTIFVGSALFFFSLTTDMLRSSVSRETELTSSHISSLIEATFSRDGIVEGTFGAKTMQDIFNSDASVGGDMDMWLISSDGSIHVRNGQTVLGNIYSDRSLDVFRDVTTGGQYKTDEYMGWFGPKTLILLHNNCCVIRPLFDGELYTVTVNYCTAVKAQQRQQFALFMLIDIILLAVTIVMITNLIFSYRRQIIRLATIDELTGLMNRKSFHTEYAEFITENRNDPFVLFLLDIDYFKQINDGYGHAAGDQALVYLADTIRSMIDEKGGFSGRWGGDEFIGVLRLNGESADEALNRLCRDIEASPRPEGYKMTISVGAVEADRAAEGENVLSKLSEKADLALYESKENGRNRATLYHSDLDKVPTVASLINSAASVSSGNTSAVLDAPSADISSDAAAVGQANASASSSASASADTSALTASDGADGRTEGRISLKINTAYKKDILSGNTVQVQGKSLRERLLLLLRQKLIESTIFGVRWMAPFVAGGGILIALAFLFDAASVDLSTLPISERSNFGTLTPLAATLKTIGGSTFNFMLPVFAGFMAYSLAGEDAFLAGFVGGFMTIETNSGFVGAMVAGLVAGFISDEIQRFTNRLPSFIRKIAPIVIFPVFCLILMQAISSLMIKPISSAVGEVFTNLLDVTVKQNRVLAGGLSGMMMATDMGGIINKVAYNYGVEGLAANNTDIMASVMIGGMVPPIGIFLSMLFFRNRFSEYEWDRGPTALFMGLSFITEGALPYVFTDFIKVIPSCMAGSAVAGALSVLFGCTLPAPHGGIFVFPVMGHRLLYAIALIIGSFVTACLLGLLKKPRSEK